MTIKSKRKKQRRRKCRREIPHSVRNGDQIQIQSQMIG
jgi:hypothetical protein